MTRYHLPGDYEKKHRLPMPHETVCPKTRRDPNCPVLLNPCGRAIGHKGQCKPMDAIQAARRRLWRLGEAARVRNARPCRNGGCRHTFVDHFEGTDGTACSECPCEKFKAEGR